jgi:hypothetical protein
VPGAVVQAGAGKQIRPIDARRLDPDDDFVALRLGGGNLGYLQHLGTTKPLDLHRSHRLLLSLSLAYVSAHWRKAPIGARRSHLFDDAKDKHVMSYPPTSE